MRIRFVLLVAVCMASVASAQWVTEEWLLPDSLSGAEAPSSIFYCPNNNTVYVGGNGTAVVAADGSTGRKVARIPTTDRQVCGMCLDSAGNKLYVVLLEELLAVDLTTNQVVSELWGVG